MTWAERTSPVKVGDTVIIAGKHKRRTFWQWLTRQPRQLQTYVITEEITSSPEPGVMDRD